MVWAAARQIFQSIATELQKTALTWVFEHPPFVDAEKFLTEKERDLHCNIYAPDGRAQHLVWVSVSKHKLQDLARSYQGFMHAAYMIYIYIYM